MSKNQQDKQYTMLAFKIMGDFGATIAIPVVLFVLTAQWAEDKYGGEPWLTIVAFVFAGLLTVKMIAKKAKIYGKKYEEIDNKEEPKLDGELSNK